MNNFIFLKNRPPLNLLIVIIFLFSSFKSIANSTCDRTLIKDFVLAKQPSEEYLSELDLKPFHLDLGNIFVKSEDEGAVFNEYEYSNAIHYVYNSQLTGFSYGAERISLEDSFLTKLRSSVLQLDVEASCNFLNKHRRLYVYPPRKTMIYLPESSKGVVVFSRVEKKGKIRLSIIRPHEKDSIFQKILK